MTSLDEIRRYLAGRTIAVVGNSAGLLDRAHGDEIDACDLVLRMNHGVPEPGQIRSLGSRTDIWACSFNDVARQAREMDLLQPKLILHLPADKRHIHPRVRERAHVDCPGNATTFARRLGARWPSTGLLALNFVLVTIGGHGRLHVFGFDHFSRPNFYVPGTRPCSHRHRAEVERSHIEALAARDRIVLHRL